MLARIFARIEIYPVMDMVIIVALNGLHNAVTVALPEALANSALGHNLGIFLRPQRSTKMGADTPAKIKMY
jgi:hypothetical protein